MSQKSTDTPDLELWAHWQERRSQAAARELVRRYSNPISNFFVNKAGQDDADELVHNVFIVLLGPKAIFGQSASFRAFVYSIARRVLYDFLRRKQNSNSINPSTNATVDYASSQINRHGESLSERGEARGLLLRALSRIPINMQIVLEMKFGGLSYKEIASVLEMPLGTMRNLLRLGEIRLRDTILSMGHSQAVTDIAISNSATLLQGMFDPPVSSSVRSAPPALAPSDSNYEDEHLQNSILRDALGLDGKPFKLGRFTSVEKIGRGGMGVVYSARDEGLGRPVAIKMLRRSLWGSDQIDLSLEAQLMAQVSHPNVAQVYEFGILRGQPFIVMEFISGISLRQWWLKDNRSWQEILRMFIEIGQGLHAIHCAGLVHRDLKPENVMVGNDGRPRVLDFGLALPLRASSGSHLKAPQHESEASDPMDSESSATDSRSGTIAYFSPEQAQATGRPLDARSDQYSFCIALHEALFGERPPTYGVSCAQILSRYLSSKNANVPALIQKVLSRGLSPLPEDRFETVAELIAELAPLMTVAHVREGLTLFFSAKVTRIDRWMLDAVIISVAGRDSTCSLDELGPSGTGWYVRISGAESHELRRIAEVLSQRIWEHEHHVQMDALSRLHDMFSSAEQRLELSMLVDRLQALVYRQTAESPRSEEFPVTTDPRKALFRLLCRIFSEDELRRWLAFEPNGSRILASIDSVHGGVERVAFDALQAMDRHQAISQRTFASLLEDRPNFRLEILNVARLFRFDL